VVCATIPSCFLWIEGLRLSHPRFTRGLPPLLVVFARPTSQPLSPVMQKYLSTALRVVITLLLLAFLLYRIDEGEVVAAMRQANPLLVAVAIILYFGAVTSNALKWNILLRAQGIRVSWSALMRYTYVGVFFNNFLPAAVGGDLMRGYQLAQETHRSADAAVSVVVDRLIGLMALTVTAVLSVLYSVITHQGETVDLSNTLWIAIAALIGLILLFMIMVSRRMREAVGRLVAGVAERLPFLKFSVPIYNNLATAVGAYRNQPSVLVLALLVGTLPYLFSNFVNYLLSLSLNPPPDIVAPLQLIHIFIFNPLIGLAQIVPLSIGGLGLNQNLYAGVYSGLLGYNEAHAVAVSLLLQLVIYFTSLPGGIIWWIGRGNKAQTASTTPEPKQ
jgi:uncharacterized protein (TIRG00374 family)